MLQSIMYPHRRAISKIKREFELKIAMFEFDEDEYRIELMRMHIQIKDVIQAVRAKLEHIAATYLIYPPYLI